MAKKYRFEIQVLQVFDVEAEDAEAARMKIINGEIDTIINTSCDDLNLDPYVSEGKEV